MSYIIENPQSLKRKAVDQGERPMKRRRIFVEDDVVEVGGGEALVVIEEEDVVAIVVVEEEEEEAAVAHSPSPLARPPSPLAPLVSPPIRPIGRVDSPTLESYMSFYKYDPSCRSWCTGSRAFKRLKEERLKQRAVELDREWEAYRRKLNYLESLK
ncbi:hypothetical protein G6F43_008324 [Rhizopus delemar]|nr:hypothetical protein G6F43_008324 [Rhizopus delemar]